MGKKKLEMKFKSKDNPLYEKDFDFTKFKEEMKKEMSIFHPFSSTSIIKETSTDNYESLYSTYITEAFSSSIVMIINRICKESSTLPDDIRNQFPIHDLLIKLTKTLMFNQLELIYLSFYLDHFGWRHSSLLMMDYLLLLGLATKKYLNKDIDLIESHVNGVYAGLRGKWNAWVSENQVKLGEMFSIIPRVLNERFNRFSKPYNTYCKNNFIDYNESVDKILQMSLPYNEGQKQSGDRERDENGEEGEKRKILKESGNKQRRMAVFSNKKKDDHEDEEEIDNEDEDSIDNDEDINQIDPTIKSSSLQQMPIFDYDTHRQYDDSLPFDLSNPLKNNYPTLFSEPHNNPNLSDIAQSLPSNSIKPLLDPKAKASINKSLKAKKGKKPKQP